MGAVFFWHPEVIIQSLLLFVQCFYFALCEDWPLIGAAANGPTSFLNRKGLISVANGIFLKLTFFLNTSDPVTV